MKSTIHVLALAALSTPAFAGSPSTPAPAAAPAASGLTLSRLGLVSDDASPFLRDTKFFINGRLRYEVADIDGLEYSNALTLRNYFGLQTGNLAGFSFLAEGEHTLDLAGNYGAFPGFNNGHAIIADPDNFQLNRLQATYANEAFGNVTVGRQAINLGDQRFVGTVGWRQNDQTFDALSANITSLTHLKFTYAYISQVNRIFGSDAPTRTLTEFDSDSHIFNASTDLIKGASLTAFALLLDFDNAPALSSNTYGIDFRSTTPISVAGIDLGYLFTAATQSDAAENPTDYDAWYFRAEAFAKTGAVTTTLGGELLGSDNGTAAFQTPLGTNHKFNGFADAFLTTPAGGLRDYYVSASITDPFAINHTVALHYFQGDDTGSHLGNEVDYVATKKLSENVTLLGKLAYLDGSSAQADIFRASVQLDYVF